jgi:predicted HicB family RNase H-like nuclease
MSGTTFLWAVCWACVAASVFTVKPCQSFGMNLKWRWMIFLEDCKAQGIAPEKPASGKLMLRVPPETHGAALVAAQAAGKSLNQWASEVLQSAANAVA